MKRTFGINCFLLKVNSMAAENAHVRLHQADDIWRPHMLRKHLHRTFGQQNSQPTSLYASGYPGDGFDNYRSSGGGHSREYSGSASNANAFHSKSGGAMDSIIPEVEGMHLTSTRNGNTDSPSEPKEDKDWARYGALLSDDDVKSMRTLVKDFVVQSLIPYMEKQIQYWNEQVAAQRRGVAGRLFTVSKRLFGQATSTANQPGSGHKQQEINGVDVSIFAHQSPEAQMRRLADFSFQIGDYRTAQAVYDSIRKDFATEKAWKYQAGAQEMAGLCHLMGTGTKYDVLSNFEQVVNLYLQKCRAPQLAIRSALLHYELFKNRGMFQEAARALEKVADEMSDLRAALMFEQAAHCYLRIDKPRVRKYAFGMVLAGFQYGKSDQASISVVK
jgi:hypothetical protein